ncbi:MAG TPA: hypothetical protein VMU39_22550 [Solirubrobacteraceae bacterium]|nr:hypothetical protein [Solirubrobacteraceae bacterium]
MIGRIDSWQTHAAARLPEWIAHADWGTAPAKRIVATAQRCDGVYVAHAPCRVAPTAGLLERMHVGAGARGPTLLGFDFPIGLPRAYAEQAGIHDFTAWFAQLEATSPFFEIAAEISEVSLERPFFPRRIATRSPGIKEQFRARLGLTASTSLRLCDRANGARGAASEMFWSLGPKAVGKATLTGWRDTLREALAEPDRRYAIWPFDGHLLDLLACADAVIVESYPADAYRRLDLRMGTPGTAKTAQRDRRADAARLHRWCKDNGVVLDEALVRQVNDGFGPSRDGEDRFDAVVGLLGMIGAIAGGREPPVPDDPAVREVEGWMFGQAVPS